MTKPKTPASVKKNTTSKESVMAPKIDSKGGDKLLKREPKANKTELSGGTRYSEKKITADNNNTMAPEIDDRQQMNKSTRQADLLKKPTSSEKIKIQKKSKNTILNKNPVEFASDVLLTSEDENVEVRRMRLKKLIVQGKERGYLTYAEINDHLPDDMLDADQIESIISMINDMGITVHDEAPDAEALLMSDASTTVTDDDVVEEAEAALSSVDSEFGRTTDPVRMYMREMGSVELLTRESEIEIAKRIEDGLRHMIQAISACPAIIEKILMLATDVEEGRLRVDELVDGFLDDRDEDLLATDISTESLNQG